MALINVDEILGDPDFFDDFDATRFVRIVGDNGRVTDVPQNFTISACIQPATNQLLEQLPEASRLTTGSNIAIYTANELVALSDTYAGDVVHWKNRDYRVLNVNDWSDFGAGYYICIAQLLQLTDSDPEI